MFPQVGGCVGAFLKKLGDSALPYVETLMEDVGRMLDKSRGAEERRIAVCIVDDLIEHSPAGRAKYMNMVSGWCWGKAPSASARRRLFTQSNRLLYGSNACT